MSQIYTCGVMAQRGPGGIRYDFVQLPLLKEVPQQHLIGATTELQRFIADYSHKETPLHEQTSQHIVSIDELQGSAEALMATLHIPWGHILFSTETQTWHLSLLDIVLYPDDYDEQPPAWIGVLTSFCDKLAEATASQ